MHHRRDLVHKEGVVLRPLLICNMDEKKKVSSSGVEPKHLEGKRRRRERNKSAGKSR